jgi:NitT/TauT family transport system substrate-binding protein
MTQDIPAGSSPAFGRRPWLAAAAATAVLPLAAPAVAQSLRKVTLVYGVQTIEGAAEGFFASLPIGLGFYREEGLDVDIQTVGGSSAALNLLASGRAQFTTHGTAGLFSGVGRGVPMKGFICQIPDYFVSVGVAEEGPVRSMADLKGKTIGINAVGGAPHLVIKAVLRNLGWNPETDVQFLAVGTALPALDALRRGRIQALATWDTIFALFEFSGQKFRYFRPDPIPSVGFTHTTNALQETLDRSPEMVVGMARAMTKSLVYMAAAPVAEITRLHFKVFPATRPTGISEEQALALDARRMEARRPVMRFDRRVFSRVERLGDVTAAQIESHRDLLANGGEIPEALPVDRYFTRQALDAANAIDVPALIERARAFRA